MSKLVELKKELQELRENTLHEFKDVDTTDFDSEKKEEWAKRNERMAELVDTIKEAQSIEKDKKEMEKANIKYDHVVYLDVSKEEVIRRLTARGRADDKPEIIKLD